MHSGQCTKKVTKDGLIAAVWPCTTILILMQESLCGYILKQWNFEIKKKQTES